MHAVAFSIPPPQPLPAGGRRRSISFSRISASARASAPAAPAASPSLYEILGLPAGANGGEIKAAYRRLARKCHPDTAAGGGQSASADEFMRLHAAYSTLSDPDKRADYDRRSVVRRRPPFTASASFPGYGRRTWETDQCW